MESPNSSDGLGSGDDNGDEFLRYVGRKLREIKSENLECLEAILKRMPEASLDGKMATAWKEVEMLFEEFNNQQTWMVKHILKTCIRFMKPVIQDPDVNAFQEIQGVLDTPRATTSMSIFTEGNRGRRASPSSAELIPPQVQPENSVGNLFVPQMQNEVGKQRYSSLQSQRLSNSWKSAVRGVFQKHARRRVCDKSLKRMRPTTRRTIAKSNATKESLREILSKQYLFGDLDATLREEIIDAFEDIRVSPGVDIIKQGEVADNFYMVDVGEFDVLSQKGNLPPVLVRTKGPGECFGELALMYDTLRNATVRAKTHALVWAVDRVTFKSIMSRHLMGSPIAQVLREASVFQKLSTREIVHLSEGSKIVTYCRGQPIFEAGQTMDKVYVIKEGQVRMSWGAFQKSDKHNPRTSSGKTIAVMDRLEILGETLLLNEEATSLWTYVASSDNTTMISIDRVLFTKDVLMTIREELQSQLITVALQRVPAFLELSSDQLSQLAEKFTESLGVEGEEITKLGDALGNDARIYVVQSGCISLAKVPEEDFIGTPKPSHLLSIFKEERISKREAGSGFWSRSRIGSLMRTQSSDSYEDMMRISQDVNPSAQKSMKRIRHSGSPCESLCSSTPWSITTYGIFGDECLLTHVKEKNTKNPSYQTSAVVESSGAVCLSVTIGEVAAILGPINEHLLRVKNRMALRKVPCLEFLTSSEIDQLSNSLGIRIVRSGEPVYRVGEPGDRLYIIYQGTVTEEKSGADDLVLGKGSYFGEHALLGDEPRSYTVLAGKESGAQLFYLDRAVLEANFGPLQEINDQRRKDYEKRGINRSIQFEELNEVGLLGTGLFGKVKLVYCRRTNEYYALKCVDKAKVEKMQEEVHLRNEKIYMSELDHPFIIKLIRTYKDNRNVYLLQELIVGRELFYFMEHIGSLQEWETAFYAGCILLALEYMHSKGIVYRDLKPENTLIGNNGYPKLIDMGFAKRIYDKRTYSLCGTPDYMAPEIIKRKGYGKAVDYWALGCLIYEMITNTSPFNRGDDPPQVVFQRIVDGRLRMPPNMSSEAFDLVKKLLDPNPETRLGCRKRGILEIKEHPFFKREVNFRLLTRQKEKPPMIPPHVDDYASLCIRNEPADEEDDYSNEVACTNKNWDDVF